MPEDQKETSGTAGQSQQAPTQEKTVPMSSYTKLQGDLQKAKDKVKEYEARDREGQSVEAQLAESRQQLADANRELKSSKVKQAAPAELHDWIDSQFEKGRDLDVDDIQVLVDRMTDSSNKSEKTEKGNGNEPKEKSGQRNSAPKQPETDDEIDTLLKNTPVRSFFESTRR